MLHYLYLLLFGVDTQVEPKVQEYTYKSTSIICIYIQDYFIITKSDLKMNAMVNITKSFIIYYNACPQSIKNECTSQTPVQYLVQTWS